jgi:hypothetical protein
MDLLVIYANEVDSGFFLMQLGDRANVDVTDLSSREFHEELC